MQLSARFIRHGSITAAACILLALALAPASGAGGISAFEGSWSAVALESEPPLEIAPEALRLEIRTSREGGFTARWSNPALPGQPEIAPQVEARFAPTDNPDVFALKAPERSLFKQLFADPKSGNPLEGDTLLWARLADDALVLYSLSIDRHGSPVLVRSAHVQDGRDLRLQRTVRVGNRKPVVIEARLAPSGS